MKRCSLRVRLLRMLLIPVALGFVIIGVTSYYNAYHEAEEIYDAQLTHFAKVLRALTQHEIEEGDTLEKRIYINEALQLHEYEKNFAYRVWLRDKTILYSSNADAFGPVSVATGFTDRIINRKHWRFFILRDGDITVEVAERYEVRTDLINHILEGIFLPQVFIIPTLALIIWIGVVQGLKPLAALSDMIRNRTPDNLERIDAPVIPTEVAVVVESINDLMQRVTDVLDREKQFTNYAAHELRTPLAALKTQLQVALRAEDDQSRELFQDLLPGIDRMQHLVEQLLAFVRIRTENRRDEQVDLATVCRHVLEDMAPVALQNKLELESEVCDTAVLHGNAEMLSALVRNLLSNALKYTGINGHVRLVLRQERGDFVLEVMDDGPGIKENERGRIFDSFYRVAGADAEGCGLGLAIVKWVADLHAASISITGGLNNTGTTFSARFPAQ